MKFKQLSVYVQRLPEGGLKARVIHEGNWKGSRVYGTNLLNDANIHHDDECMVHKVMAHCAKRLLGTSDSIRFEWQKGFNLEPMTYEYPEVVCR